jgi:hypothetical protein
MTLRDWVSRPSEPSVAGMLLLSGLGGVLVARPQPATAAAALGLLAFHFLTFDPAFNALRRRHAARFTLLAAANAAPYLAAAAAGIMPLWALLLAGDVLASHALLFATRGPRDPLVYIYGAAVPVLPALSLPAAVGALNRAALVYWLLLTGHAVATAAYVETKLPWRRRSPAVPPAAWAPFAAAGLVAAPETIVALVEPTVKLARNLVDKNRVIDPRPENIRRLGWTEMKRLVLFTGLLVAALLAAEQWGLL